MYINSGFSFIARTPANTKKVECVIILSENRSLRELSFHRNESFIAFSV